MMSDAAWYPWCFTVSKTVISFDYRRGQRSVGINDFDPTMFDEPAWGETHRKYPVIELYEDFERAKALNAANSRAEDLLQEVVMSYDADYPHFSECTGDVNEDGTIWRLAVSIFGKERCEIQVEEQPPPPETLSSPEHSERSMERERFEQIKARSKALMTAFDPLRNLEHHEWAPLSRS
ncbi:MAG: hypothetical protein Q9218_006979 [Villophora microphyllina]